MTAKELAEKTADAYSAALYGPVEWTRCARLLQARAYTDREVEAILRSKWTRWAADGSYTPQQPTAADLAKFLDSIHGRKGYSVAELVAQTFCDEDEAPDFERTALIAERDALVAAAKGLVERDCQYDGARIIIPTESHAEAIRLVSALRRAIATAEGK